MGKKEAVQLTIKKVLEPSCLNSTQIKKLVTYQIDAHDQINLKADLHGLTLEEVKTIIQLLVDSKKLKVRVLELVHGYNRGSVLKDYIEKDFSHIRLENKIKGLSNEGITKLYLKPWHDVANLETKHKTKAKKSILDSNQIQEQTEDDISNLRLFELTMIKETIKRAKVHRSMTVEALEPFLYHENLDILMPLLGIDLNKEELLFRIQNIYTYEGALIVMIKTKKMQLNDVKDLVTKLLKMKREQPIVLKLEHQSKWQVMIRDFIANNLKDDDEMLAKIGDCQTVIKLHPPMSRQ
ncbi:MAG: Smr/MutS family protein [Vallitaleaceae bacterium]|nr:Smr/MutS family protein [Vallitaleaceae bacterium]